VLEFAMPTAPVMRSLYAWYFRNVLPRVGRLVSRHGDAYDYLPASVGTFFMPAEFGALVRSAALPACEPSRSPWASSICTWQRSGEMLLASRRVPPLRVCRLL